MHQTEEQFKQALNKCKAIFEKKLHDYGAAWRILRPQSITDQLYIKANRIRSFELKQVQKVEENSLSEYIGLVNYAIIGLIQLEYEASETIDMTPEQAIGIYDKKAREARELMIRKNHDYDEAWRKMRVSSYTDLILMKIFRVKQIEDNQGKTQISEGIDANYMDILNYAVFAIIKLAAFNDNDPLNF